MQSAYGIPVEGALRAPYSRVFGAFFNSDENPVFARLEVRQALSLAVDRTNIVNNVLGGYATPLTGPVLLQTKYLRTKGGLEMKRPACGRTKMRT